MSVRDLSKLDPEELAEFLDSFDTVLTDCDGVLWVDTPLPGSAEVIAKLQELSKKVFFVSNNSTLSLNNYLKKFNSFGYRVQKEEIMIPSVVIASYLKDVGFNKKALIIGSKPFVDTLESEGIDCIVEEKGFVVETIPSFINQLESLDSELGAVIVDFDPNVTYLQLMKAVTVLKKEGSIFIVGASDTLFPLTKEILLLGPGHFVSILKSMTGQEPVIAGKPSILIKDAISKRYPINPKRTLIIGDAITQDIKLGTDCGFQTLLVLSGISKLEDATKDPTNQPHFYLKTLGDLLPLLSGTLI